MIGDNMAVMINTTTQSSTLKKKYQACNFHKFRESIAAGFIYYAYISRTVNNADV